MAQRYDAIVIGGGHTGLVAATYLARAGDSGRGTPWEIHPVTLVELCCWRELS